jgi:hypothetical protein
LIPALRGPEGPLFHGGACIGRARIHELFRSFLSGFDFFELYGTTEEAAEKVRS